MDTPPSTGNSLNSFIRQIGHSRRLRGQALLEMTFLTIPASFIIIALIEGAVLFSHAYCVTELAYQGARYAANNPGYDVNAIETYMNQIAPKYISSPAQLQFTIQPSTTPRQTGDQIIVTVAYSLPHPLTVLNFTFPRTLTASDTMMSE